MGEHRNRSHVERTVWVTGYRGTTFDTKVKPDLPAEGELVGYYDLEHAEQVLKRRFGFRVLVEEVEHRQVKCKMTVEEFYNASMKERI